MWCTLYNVTNGCRHCCHFTPTNSFCAFKTSLDQHSHEKCQTYEYQIRDITRVDDAVTEIMHAAKDEAAPAATAELSEDSKIEEEEAEVPTEAARETDVQEAKKVDGIHAVFLSKLHSLVRYKIKQARALNLLLSHH